MVIYRLDSVDSYHVSVALQKNASNLHVEVDNWKLICNRAMKPTVREQNKSIHTQTEAHPRLIRIKKKLSDVTRSGLIHKGISERSIQFLLYLFGVKWL